jgi:hypothetical protein
MELSVPISAIRSRQLAANVKSSAKSRYLPIYLHDYEG